MALSACLTLRRIYHLNGTILYPRVFLLLRCALVGYLATFDPVPCRIMLALRRFFSLALLSAVCASTLDARQSTNTNAAIISIVNSLDMSMHKVCPTVLTLMANQTLSDSTLGAQMSALNAAFDKTATDLASTPASSGSTTVRPTNDDISVTYADSLQLVAASLSGIIASGKVSTFASMVSTLDPIMAKATTQLGVTSPGSLTFVTDLMKDAQQFLLAEGLTQTRSALGFT
ncbi:hypothetical protein B0H15DRAFT_845657 [Mycena belliarum]|uniref:Uncharacterized protein n=1 Tax=Mycena belliarum TaxID=1033014 RepID=A0AAD6XTJ0_9AGAR|nr:hypothetical protein B0H15DRAFT_845657 [Mycena belliae]